MVSGNVAFFTRSFVIIYDFTIQLRSPHVEIIIEALLTPPPTPQPVGRPRKALQSSHSYLAGVFEEALAEENEAQAVLALVEEVVQLEVRVVCAETLGSYQLDAALASRERAREVVESKQDVSFSSWHM